MAKKKLKVGIQAGAGRAPGYNWTVLYLAVAREEASRFLGPAQYAHVVDQIKSLAREEDPTHPQTVSVDAIEDFFELREKGGPLGRTNVRVFFVLDKEAQAIVVLGAIKKEADGATPAGDRIRMRYRRRKYLAGEFEED